MRLLLALLLIVTLVVIGWIFLKAFADDTKQREMRNTARRANPQQTYALSNGDVFDQPMLQALREVDAAPDMPERQVFGGRVLTRVAANPHNPLRVRRTAAQQARAFLLDALTAAAVTALHDARLGNAPLEAADELAQLDFMVFDGFNDEGLFFDTAVAKTREATIAARQQEAALEATPQGAVERYVELAQLNTNDTQNVHDGGVLSGLKGISQRLSDDRAARGDPLPSIEALAQELKSGMAAEGIAGAAAGGAHSGRAKDIADVIDRIAGSSEFVDKIGIGDRECLRLVADRGKDPRNRGNSGKMRTALYDALADCWESDGQNRKIVCVNGRTGRLLGSLAMLDWDSRNWNVLKTEQLKNDIFAELPGIVREEAARAAASPDDGERRAGLAWLAKTPAELESVGEVPPKAAEDLLNKITAAADRMVDRHVSQTGEALIGMADNLKNEVRAGLVNS